jgi:hypothetical protein
MAIATGIKANLNFSKVIAAKHYVYPDNFWNNSLVP